MITKFPTKLSSEEIFCNPGLIKVKSSEEIYTTTKKYQNKLFRIGGYKSVNTVMDLEELAKFKVTEVHYEDYSAYADPELANYIFVNDLAYKAYTEFFDFLDKKASDGYSYTRVYTEDNFITNDQFLVKNPSGNQYIVVFNMVSDSASIYYYDSGIIIYAASIDMTNEDQIEYLIDTITQKFTSYDIKDQVQLTYKELADVLISLGILKTSKRGYKLLIDEDDELITPMINVSGFLNSILSMSPLERVVSLTNYKVENLTKLIDKIVKSEVNLPVDSLSWICDLIVTEGLASSTEDIPFKVVEF